MEVINVGSTGEGEAFVRVERWKGGPCMADREVVIRADGGET